MGGVFSGLLSYFYTKQLDIVLLGLSGAGKTTFSQALALNKAQDTVPTVGLEIQVFKKNGITCKVWDLGGQAAYRQEWSRYVRGSDIIVFVIDTQYPYDLVIAKKELHALLDDNQLKGVPILVLANKIDLGSKISGDQEIVEGLNLDYITENPWLIIQCSAKTGQNIDKAIEFLLKYAH